jgi:chromosome partitioning protein
MATKILCIANQKGGVGKTTTTVNIGHGLARRGHNVLMIDLDPQGQVASVLNCPQEGGTYYLLTMGRSSPTELNFVKTLVRSTGRANLWYIPGNFETVRAQNDVSNRNPPAPISHIREMLDIFTKNGLSYILLDTSPSIGGLQERALWAADGVIIPTNMDYLSNEGVSNVARDLSALVSRQAWGGKLLGVLPTFYDPRTKPMKEAMRQLKEAFGTSLLPPINRSSIFAAASAEGQTIFEYAEANASSQYAQRAMEQYDQLVQAIIRAK